MDNSKCNASQVILSKKSTRWLFMDCCKLNAILRSYNSIGKTSNISKQYYNLVKLIFPHNIFWNIQCLQYFNHFSFVVEKKF